jgi:dihydrodiol dehydrogenase / D-xylose 1-dehydrogenase (NADP)
VPKKWLREQKVPNTTDVKIFQSCKKVIRFANFDIVYISVPHPLHYQHIFAALKYKGNVLVEKACYDEPSTI